jgi:hypothetical protein
MRRTSEQKAIVEAVIIEVEEADCDWSVAKYQANMLAQESPAIAVAAEIRSSRVRRAFDSGLVRKREITKALSLKGSNREVNGILRRTDPEHVKWRAEYERDFQAWCDEHYPTESNGGANS